MSVIIRLQNLPWNANALDIRRFFQGLSIPDGGVHIIGGEKGDSFIAFSTDEDARQAMMKDTGRINGYPVRLLLSSKTEMQNVIAAAKGGPPPPLPAASGMGIPKPVAFYNPVIPAVGAAPMQFVGGAGDVTGSGQGLRSSTGLGSLPVPYGYPGTSGQVIAPVQPAGSVLRMNEPRSMPAVPAMQPAARSVFDTRPPERPPVLVNIQQQPPAMDPMMSGLRPAVPTLPPAGVWTSSQPPMSYDRPPPPEFSQPADIPVNQGVGFTGFNPPTGGGEPARHLDANYQRNGHAFGALEGGRNLVGGIDVRSSFGGPPADVGRDFGRGESSVPFGRGEAGMSLGRPEDQRDARRLVGDQPPSWREREAARPETGPGQGWSSSGRSYGGREADNDPRNEFQRRELDGRTAGPDRWVENRAMGSDRGPRDITSDRPLPRPGAVDPQIDLDRYGPSRQPLFSEASRFGPDSSSSKAGIPDNRPRGEPRPGFAHPEPRFREPPRPLMEDCLLYTSPSPRD